MVRIKEKMRVRVKKVNGKLGPKVNRNMRYCGIVKDEIRNGGLQQVILYSIKKMLLLFSDNMVEYVILSSVVKPTVMRARRTRF